MENWRDIPGFHGYQVSSLGRVRSVDRVVKTERGQRRYKGKLLKPGIGSHGYLTVAIGKGNSQCVHVLVGLAFLGPKPFPEAEIRHQDDCPFHNWPDNLLWGSRADNGRDKKWNKGQKGYVLTPADVSAIKRELAAPYFGQGEALAKRYGVVGSTISAIKRGHFHKDVV